MSHYQGAFLSLFLAVVPSNDIATTKSGLFRLTYLVKSFILISQQAMAVALFFGFIAYVT